MAAVEDARDNDMTVVGWRNRIIGHGEEAPDQLLANPMNWRIHPYSQQQAVASVLDTVGWVQQVIVNRRTGFVVDGHLRVALALSAGSATVPVVYVDLDESEEALILASLDPLAALAVTDFEQLQDLLGQIPSLDDGALADMFDGMLVSAPTQRTASPTDHSDLTPVAITNDAYVSFAFGEYRGIVRREVYERFVTAYQAHAGASGDVMLTDIVDRIIPS